MADITESIDVDVPIRIVYDQWTQFEEFPRFMDGVERVRQTSDTMLEWESRIGGVRRTWTAKILDQQPDRVISWAATEGTKNSGRVSFEPLGPNRTRVTLQLGFEPEGLVEQVGDKLGVVGRTATGDLERFRDYIERRGVETGSWRGEVYRGVSTDEMPLNNPVAEPGDPRT